MDRRYLDRDAIVETKNLSTNLPKTTLIHMTKYNTAAKSIGETPWLNWIEQPPPKGQVAGSNPAGVAIHVPSYFL